MDIRYPVPARTTGLVARLTALRSSGIFRSRSRSTTGSGDRLTLSSTQFLVDRAWNPEADCGSARP